MRTPVEANPEVSLTVVGTQRDARSARARRGDHLPWPLAAIAWSLAAAGAVWIVAATLPIAAWVAAGRAPAPAVLHATAQTWLAAHGASAHLGGVVIGLIPLGLTLVAIAACAAAAHHAAERYALPVGSTPAERWRAVAAVAGTCVASYCVAALIMALIVGDADRVTSAVFGAMLVALLGAGLGAARGLDAHPTDLLPAWVAQAPRAVGVGLLGLTLASAVVAVTALVAHWSQVQAVLDTLDPDPAGQVILAAVQVAYLPTVLLWAGAFLLGAGITTGGGGVLSPGHVEMSALPAIPVLGSLPTVSTGADWAWLSLGVLAGAAAGVMMVRGTEPTWVEAAWRGALAGAATGAVWCLASWFAVGDLGTRAMVGWGPRFPHLWFFAVGPLALAGAAAALGAVLVRARRAAHGETPEAG